MEVKELMIGDWVKFSEPDCGGHRVDYISEMDDEVGVDGEILDLNMIAPIPLTPEILEKNGFEKMLDEYNTECYRYYSSAADGYVKITLWDGGDGDWGFEIINYEKFDNNEVVYKNDFIFLKVHELQHALKLCKIDKEIELCKK